MSEGHWGMSLFHFFNEVDNYAECRCDVSEGGEHHYFSEEGQTGIRVLDVNVIAMYSNSKLALFRGVLDNLKGPCHPLISLEGGFLQ